MVFFSALNYCLTLISPAGLNDLIYTLIQTPLKHMGTNIFAVIILGLWVISSGCWGSTDLIQRRQFEKPFFLRLIWRISPGPLNTALPGARHIRLPGLLLMMHSPTAAVQVWRWGYCWLFLSLLSVRNTVIWQNVIYPRYFQYQWTDNVRPSYCT